MELSHHKLLILRPSGRLDSASSQDFEQQMSEFVQSGNDHLLLDMFEVEYLSSAGLRVLLMTAKKLAALEGTLILCTVPEHVKEVLDLAGFSRVFETSPNVEQAVRALTANDDEVLTELTNRAKAALTSTVRRMDFSTTGLDLAALRAELGGESGPGGSSTGGQGGASGPLARLRGLVRRLTQRIAARGPAKPKDPTV